MKVSSILLAIGTMTLIPVAPVMGQPMRAAVNQRPTAVDADAAARRDIAAFAHRVITELGTAPGVAVAVVRKGKPVYSDTFGLATTNPKKPADAQTLFYLASSTKPFTGLAIASLGRKGLVDLDAPISRWLPNSGLPRGIADTITLRELVSLQAGVDNDPITTRLAFTGDHSPALLQRLLAETTTIAKAPRGTFTYSNGGFNIATTLIERKLGLSWQRLVEREVLVPAGMRSTTPYPSRAISAGRVLAAGHVAERGPALQTKLQKSDSLMQSAGGLYTTAGDLARWLSLQLNDGVIDGRRVFPAGLVASTHKPLVNFDTKFGPYHRTGYGLGWYTGSERGRPMIHAFGSFVGNWSHVSFRPDRGVGVAVLVNEEAFGGQVTGLISNYAYDRLAGLADIDALYAMQLTEAKAKVTEARAQASNEMARRAARPWMLTLPRGAYAGAYVNPSFGTIQVANRPQGLVISFGLLSAIAEPYTKPDAVRVAFTPSQASVVTFKAGKGGAIDELTYGDISFRRVREVRR
jgi:CubicO group peptidase (beta-lactamase class C family)